MKLEGLSLFFPCHNEESNVERVVREALFYAAQVADEIEIIIVDDGSRDRTADIVAQLMKEDPRVRLVRHPRNRGYGEALKTGFRAAKLPWVFYSDGDGQFDLRELSTLASLSDGADIVSGFRMQRADPWHRKLNAFVFEQALKFFFRLHVPDVDCAFKLYRREIFSGMELKTSGAMIDAEVLTRAQRRGAVIKSLGVSHRPRMHGTSSGANPRVVFKAMSEFRMLWWDLMDLPSPWSKNVRVMFSDWLTSLPFLNRN